VSRLMKKVLGTYLISLPENNYDQLT